jgi:hypothetical protein
LRERKGAGLRPIAANDNEGIYVALAEKMYRFQLCVIGFEFGIPLAAQDRPAMLDNSADISKTQRKKVVAGQACVAMADAESLPIPINCSSYGSSDCSVDPRSVSTAGHNGDLGHTFRSPKVLLIIAIGLGYGP